MPTPQEKEKLICSWATDSTYAIPHRLLETGSHSKMSLGRGGGGGGVGLHDFIWESLSSLQVSQKADQAWARLPHSTEDARVWKRDASDSRNNEQAHG